MPEEAEGGSEVNEDDETAVIDTGEVNIEAEADLVNVEERPYFDSTLTQLAIDQKSSSALTYRSCLEDEKQDGKTELNKKDGLKESLADKVSQITKSKQPSTISLSNTENTSRRRRVNIRFNRAGR